MTNNQNGDEDNGHDYSHVFRVNGKLIALTFCHDDAKRDALPFSLQHQ